MPIARPLRCPTVKAAAPWCVPIAFPSPSRISPGSAPTRSASQPRVSPSGMKQMSWLSGFCATWIPRAWASARTSALEGVDPSGK